METVSFATANRGVCPERVSYAYQMLLKGHGYQSAALAAGLSAQTLRQLCPPSPQPKRVEIVIPEPIKLADDATPAERTEAILVEVCRRYGISRRELMDNGKGRRGSIPRQEAFARLCRERRMPHEEIGKLFSRDHSTVCTGIQRFDERQAWCEVVLILAGSVHSVRPKTDRFPASSPRQKLQITGIF